MCVYVYVYNGDKMAADGAHYRELSEGEWRALPAAYLHAAHAMLYAEWPGKFLDKYDFKYAVMVRAMLSGGVRSQRWIMLA